MPTGPAVYLRELISALAQIDKTNSYTLYFQHDPRDDFLTKLTKQNPKFSYVVLPSSLSWTQVSLTRELIKNPTDIFFTSVHTIPFFAKVLKPSIKFVSMVHGLEYILNQTYTDLSIKKIIQPAVLAVTADCSSAVIVPSESTKRAIGKQFGFFVKSKVHVIYEGLNESFRQPLDPVATQNTVKKYGLEGAPYLVFLSTIQPRKNLPLTIKAFANVVPNNKALKLCVIGKNGWRFEESLEAPKKSGVEKNVIFLGPLVTEEVRALLSSAKGFVNFSLDEGFGLPLLEAMALGLKCGVSDIPAFRELGQNYPVYADPKSETAISDAINSLLNPSWDNVRLENQRNHALSFSWDTTAEQTLRLFQSLF